MQRAILKLQGATSKAEVDRSAPLFELQLASTPLGPTGALQLADSPGSAGVRAPEPRLLKVMCTHTGRVFNDVHF